MNTHSYCYPCVEPLQGSSNKHDLVRGAANYPCHLCGRLFKSVSNRNLHVREVHANTRAYRCDICSFSTQHKRALDMHMRLHSDEKPYHCPFCLYRAKRSFEITKHAQAMHDNGRPKRKRREEEIAREFDPGQD